MWHHDAEMTDVDLERAIDVGTAGVQWLDDEEMRAWRTLLTAHGRLARVLDEELEVLLGRRQLVLEVNAFGDLLHGTIHRGLDTYEAEVQALLGGLAA